MKAFLSFYKSSLLLFCILLNFSLFAQIKNLYYIDDFKILDSARFEITYKFEKIPDLTKPDKKETDIQKLLIGHKISKSFSYLLFQNDSVCTILEKQNSETVPSIPKAASSYEVYKNKITKGLLVTYREDETVFQYEEEMPVFDWKIQNDRKTIMTYPCQKAITEFRGRKYVAWFTSAIPISEGPYKFSGLPGLIIEISDTQGHYFFSCISVKMLKPLRAIKNRNWRYTETTREKLNQLLVKKYKNITEYYNAMGVTFNIMKDGKVIANPKDYRIPYNPIELE